MPAVEVKWQHLFFVVVVFFYCIGRDISVFVFFYILFRMSVFHGKTWTDKPFICLYLQEVFASTSVDMIHS